MLNVLFVNVSSINKLNSLAMFRSTMQIIMTRPLYVCFFKESLSFNF